MSLLVESIQKERDVKRQRRLLEQQSKAMGSGSGVLSFEALLPSDCEEGENASPPCNVAGKIANDVADFHYTGMHGSFAQGKIGAAHQCFQHSPCMN